MLRQLFSFHRCATRSARTIDTISQTMMINYDYCYVIRVEVRLKDISYIIV